VADFPGVATFLERDGLLDEIGQLVDRASAGQGSMALIAGEAGAGKTTLVREAAHRFSSRAIVLVGGCDPLTTPRPLSPVLDVISDPGSGLGDLIVSTSDPVSLFSEFLVRLKGTVRPTILIIEDLHWADEGTLDFIRFLGRRIRESKAVVMCTYRDDEIDGGHPLRVVIGDLATRESIRRLYVQPLSIEAVRALTRGTSVDPGRLHEATGGNAFYVTEVIAAGTEVPASVQDAVLARLSRLRVPTRRVVEAVSIAPRDLSISHTSALARAKMEHLDEAATSGMLIGVGDRLRFRHELARAAVEDAIPTATRLDLHRRMIGLLVEQERPDLARLAHHSARAEAGKLVAEYAPQAAEEAARRGAHREAVSFYEEALAHARHLIPDDVAALHLALGRELATLDRQVDALAERELAVRMYREKGEPVQLAKALLDESGSHWANRNLGESRAAVDEALSLLEDSGNEEELALAWYFSGYFWMLARQHQPAMSSFAMAEALARGCGSDRVLNLVDYMVGTTELVTGEADRGVMLIRESIRRYEELGDSRMTQNSLEMLGSGGGESRVYAPALEALERGVELGLRTDEDYLVAYNRSWMARIAFEQGRWDEAATYADQVVTQEIAGRGYISPVTALGALGRVRVRRGDPGAKEALEKALEIGHGGEMQHLWSPLCGLSELAWLEGRRGEIPGILEWVFAEAMAADSTWARGEVGFWMWKAGAIDEPPERAAAPFDLHMKGDWEAAAEVWLEIGCPYERALALADGDTAAMLESIEIFDRLGARPAASMTRSRLRDRGVEGIPRGPRPRTQANPFQLTDRQIEVLGLMGDGLSNGEIADHLFISKKTVEHHVSAVLAKLGTPTRAKAIAMAESLVDVQDGGRPRPE
jgi:DNA-binding CsgD family transcriptional regulator/tetratricopeptide (TPR) repeat protein